MAPPARPPGLGPRAAFALVAALVLLAIVETAQALIAPGRAPTDADWEAAAREVRAGFADGDLVVAAPAWADPLVRMHLGDLIPIPVAARLDDARYGRVWEVAQRGAHADEGRGAVALEKRLGALTVRRYERPAAEVTYDFLERWQEARVSVALGDPRAPTVSECPFQQDRFTCAATGTTVRRELVEVDTRIRRALLAPPGAGAVVALEFPGVIAGRELVVAAGLHDTWARKYATGTVDLQVLIDGAPALAATVGNRSGWRLLRVDTAARAGRPMIVRFQISSARPELRHFALAAEARR